MAAEPTEIGSTVVKSEKANAKDKPQRRRRRQVRKRTSGKDSAKQDSAKQDSAKQDSTKDVGADQKPTAEAKRPPEPSTDKPAGKPAHESAGDASTSGAAKSASGGESASGRRPRRRGGRRKSAGQSGSGKTRPEQGNSTATVASPGTASTGSEKPKQAKRSRKRRKRAPSGGQGKESTTQSANAPQPAAAEAKPAAPGNAPAAVARAGSEPAPRPASAEPQRHAMGSLSPRRSTARSEPFGFGIDADDASSAAPPTSAADAPPADRSPAAFDLRERSARPDALDVPAESAAEAVTLADEAREAAAEGAGDNSGQDDHADPHGHAGRLVLKARPPRRARGGRKHRKKTATATTESPTESSQSAAKKSAELAAEQPAESDAKSTEAPKTAPAAGEKKRPARRKRSRKKKGAAPAATAAAEDDTDDESAAPVETVEQFIDLEHGDPRPLTGGREMIINVTAGAECRIAILDSGRLEELYLERQSLASHVGNIYMGRVTNVEPSIQAAFIDFGLAKNGFLHISDVLPKYFPNNRGELEQVGKKVPRRDRPPIQKCFRRGDNVIVQVVKEGVGTKGPTLTTYLSIPGQFMVMMPGMDRLGVSRKIEDDQDRREMRELLNQLNLPEGIGFILRTAGLNRTKRELQSDLNYLNRLWKTVDKRIAEKTAPCELYQESDLVIRTIRDVYTSDFKRIVVDDANTARKVREFLRIAMPRTPGMVVEYRRPEPLFHKFGIEEEIERIHSRHVPLPSGGSIVIDSTEAMVAIDVNSGKFRDLSDAEETAFRINLEAAEEIARQLRLRDLGGLVVCDFIDLRMDRHKRAVEKALRDALKKHKERARILRMSKFGLIEMTRQRQRQSIKRSVFIDCPHCKGGGLVKAPESMSLEVIRILQLLAHRREVRRIIVRTAPSVASLVLNDRRAFIHQLEQRSGKQISILHDTTFASDQVQYECIDDRGMPLPVEV